MKPFHTIAIPHDDILTGRLTMDVFAADLWEVKQNRGADEYRDTDTFFKKTYLTLGLQNLLSVVKKRIRGKGGDPIIQIQTPFGGGKTHALIAMYHKAQEWGAQSVVAVGTALGPKDTLWGLLEEQLTGKVEKCTGQVSPGKETLRNLLADNQPIIILMDEVLEYATKAAGVKVGNSNLAAQTMAFMQELTEAISTLEKVCLVVTLPASLIEHYDEGAEKLYQQLQKVSGRVEKIYTPVEENEISKIIRRRLFNEIDLDGAKETASSFVEYADKENISPGSLPPSEYRTRFTDSYPFTPEVIDVLYQRWGSFHTFQRTRGVLRLLSLVIHSLKDSNQPYISLSDFDLGNQELRQELIKHIGAEFNSIISSDITSGESGSQKVNNELGKAYRGLNIGTRTSTTIFLYSFSGGQEHGTTLGEIKRSATTLQNPSPLVAEAIEQLKGKLFYLQSRADKYYFSNQANLNRILLNNVENIKETDLIELESDLLRISIRSGILKTYIWEDKPFNISDSEELKLVILKKEDKALINDMLKSKGQTPRVYRNTVFFLYPLDAERSGFINTLKRKIAFENISTDKHLNLSDDQKKEVKDEIKKIEPLLKESIRRLYRMVAIPDKDGFKVKDLGIPTYGLNKSLDEELFEQLRLDGEILEKIAPIVLKEKYLTNKDYVSTDQLYQSTLKTPGEARPSNRNVLESGIVEGIQMGIFGLGEFEDERPKCIYFKQFASVSFTGDEILIKDTICEEQKKEKIPEGEIEYSGETERTPSQVSEEEGTSGSKPEGEVREQLSLKFEIPKGKVSGIMGLMNLLQNKFNILEISLSAKDGCISQQEIDDKIAETFRQLNIEFDLE
ncbi:ATP-binding protein [Bacteroidota bacterium]